MNKNSKRIILISAVLIAFCAAFWFFTDIFIYMFAALILSILGSPLVNLLMRIKIKKHFLPKSVAATLTLIVITLILSGIFYLLFPLLAYEIQQLSAIDPALVIAGINDGLVNFETFLRENHLVNKDFHLSEIIISQTNNFISSINVTAIFGNIIDVLSTAFIFIFSVIFMTYFSLKDNHIFWKMIKKMIPISLRNNFDNIIEETKNQLIRYFGGVLIEMTIVGVLEGLLCYFFGVPNALLIGVIGGVLNIIPYVGPLIAGGIAIVIGATSTLPLGISETVVGMICLKITIAFVIVKLLDDFIIQPTISGKSVNAHPLEIFIVILVAGRIGGIWGMMFAVPAYTLVRIIIKEFFSQYFISTVSGNDSSPTINSEEEETETQD